MPAILPWPQCVNYSCCLLAVQPYSAYHMHSWSYSLVNIFFIELWCNLLYDIVWYHMIYVILMNVWYDIIWYDIWLIWKRWAYTILMSRFSCNLNILTYKSADIYLLCKFDDGWSLLFIELLVHASSNFLKFVANLNFRCMYFVTALAVFVQTRAFLTHWGWVTHMHQYNIPTLVQIMTCHLFSTKSLSELMLEYCWLDP